MNLPCCLWPYCNLTYFIVFFGGESYFFILIYSQYILKYIHFHVQKLQKMKSSIAEISEINKNPKCNIIF